MKLKRFALALVLLCLALVLILPAQSVRADRADLIDPLPTYREGPYSYEDDFGGGVYIFDCDNDVSGHLTIPAELGGRPVTTIGVAAFGNLENLISVTIPDSVTRIQDRAFASCPNLTSVTIPDSVTSIGSDAFYFCGSLTSITLPSGVKSYGEGVFSHCTSLTSITFSSGATIGAEMFQYCSGLTSVTIPAHVRGIGKAAFAYCSGLTSVIIEGGAEGGVPLISEKTFYKCANLQSVSIGNSVTKIYESAFAYCDSLTSITIPDSVTAIERAAFCACVNLSSAKIGNNVTRIGDYMFSHCTSLNSITIPDGVTSIGGQAFWNCSGLTSVSLPASITLIDEGAFRNCSNLKRVFFCGTEARWPAIKIGAYNTYLTEAPRIYHQFTPGTGESCPICGKEDYQEKLDIQGVSRAKTLLLENIVYMRATVAFLDKQGNEAKLSREEILENGKILFWKEKGLPAGELTVENATAVQKLQDAGVYDDGIREYSACSYGVAPKEYGDVIYYCTYIVVDGVEYYGQINEYSVLTYANNQFKKNSPSLKPLLAAMLNYGAAAQRYFGYKTDEPVNACLQDWVDKGTLDESVLTMQWEEALLDALQIADEEVTRNFRQNDACRINRSLVLDGVVRLKMSFVHKQVDGKGSKLPAGASVRCYYWSNAKYNELYDEGRVLSKGNATYVLTGAQIQETYNSKQGYVYHAYFDGLPAKRMGEAVYIAAVFTMADGTEYCSGVEVYSPEAYTASMLKKETTPASLATLIKWMVIYGEEARKYFA